MTGLKYITPDPWGDYELLDSGGGQKLERFGALTLSRPEPQAVWQRSLDEWHPDALFSRSQQNDERGEWARKSSMPDRWSMRYAYKKLDMRLRLAMTSFKHVGLFPEQAANWNFIYDNSRAGMRILNLFAYTGGATLAALGAGAEAVHVDSVKQVVAWARENVAESSLDGARWIVDDATKFALREGRRGNKYDGIILDPPAYGRGPDGEKWLLERDLHPLLTVCASLLKPHGFLVLNLYSMGLSPLVARTLVHQTFGAPEPLNEQFGELYLADKFAKSLPLGVYYRFVK